MIGCSFNNLRYHGIICATKDPSGEIWSWLGFQLLWYLAAMNLITLSTGEMKCGDHPQFSFFIIENWRQVCSGHDDGFVSAVRWGGTCSRSGGGNQTFPTEREGRKKEKEETGRSQQTDDEGDGGGCRWGKWLKWTLTWRTSYMLAEGVKCFMLSFFCFAGLTRLASLNWPGRSCVIWVDEKGWIQGLFLLWPCEE